jgi:hypothetical protein
MLGICGHRSRPPKTYDRERSGGTLAPEDESRPAPVSEPATEYPPLPKPRHRRRLWHIKKLWADFLSAIETDRCPVCDTEEIHYWTNPGLPAMLSYKLGWSVCWDSEREGCPEDAQANGLLRREYGGAWKYPEA